MSMPSIPASSISLGYLLQSERDLQAGRARIHTGDILRCIGVMQDARTFVNRRTRATYTLALSALPSNFRSIGFDGPEDITL